MWKSSLIIEHMDYLDFLRGIPDESVDLVVTDPPYGVGWAGGTFNGRKTHKPKISGDLESFSYLPLARETHRILKRDTAAFFFTRWDVYGEHLNDLSASGLKPREPLIIQRRGGSIGDLEGTFSPYSEWCLFSHKGQFKFRKTQLLRNHTRGSGVGRVTGKWKTRFPSCWFGSEYPDSTDTSRKRGKHTHPTIKSQKLIQWLILLCSDPGATVVDPFLGSGTTAAACLATGRNFLGCDIDGGYVRAARERIRAKGFGV